MIMKHRIPLFRAAPAVIMLLVFLCFPAISAAADPEKETVLQGEELLITSHPVGQRGGRLVAALRSAPGTLNPVLSVDNASRTLIRGLTADLIHINLHSQETELALAKSWRVSEDGRRFTLERRRGIRFSDGHPFDADDVIFTFEVYLDEKVASPIRDLLIVGGKPIKVRKLDSYTVEFEMAQPYGAGERIFDGIAILPRHLLQQAYERGTISQEWGLTTPPEQIVGLGPFRLREYIPGERCVLARNPYFWKADAAGARLPYLDELTFIFVASDDAQALRFQTGETDVIDRLSAENFAVLESQQTERGYRLFDLGPSLDYNFLTFNLNDLAGKNLAKIAAKQSWFRRLEFRRAVSAAIDREGIMKLVYRGRGTPLWTFVSPGDKRWRNTKIPQPPRSLTRARDYLKAAGFTWNAEGQLLDRDDNVVEFSIATSSSNSQRLQMATIIQEDLRQLGMRVQVATLDHHSLLERVAQSFDYEAAVLGLGGGAADPNVQMPVLLSKGGLHVWRLGQNEPATPWEAEVDRLMMQQLVTTSYDVRKRLYDRVQELMAEQLPLVFLATPNVLVGAKSNLANFKPAIMRHPTLWNVEELFWEKIDPGTER